MSAFSNLVRGQTHIDFARWWARGFVVSAVLIVISVGSLFTRGLNLGIDFEGGTAWEVIAPGVTVSQARDELSAVGLGDAKIQIVGEDTLRVQSATDDAAAVEQGRQALGDLAGVPANEVSVSTVGPTWGETITRSALRALIIFLIAIMIYLTIRLEWEMAVGAIVAVLHDIVISIGVYSIFRFEVTPGTVIAFLTILGYSIYDTIVVYDKIKENDGRVGLSGRMTYTEMASLSMNQVLLRSLNTSITSLLPVIALLVVGSGVLGAVTLQEFGIALFVGLISGVYSSIFIATPVVVRIKERQGKLRTIRERLEASRAGAASASHAAGQPAVTSAGGTGAGVPTATGASGPAPIPTGAIPPRPRKKGRKR